MAGQGFPGKENTKTVSYAVFDAAYTTTRHRLQWQVNIADAGDGKG